MVTTQDDMSRASIPAPPLGSQRAIADFLEAETARIDALIANKHQLVARLDEYVASLLEEVIWSDRSGLIPLMHLTQPGRQIMYGIVLPGPNVVEGVPIVKGGDVAAGRLTPGELCRTTVEIEVPFARARLQADDLVFAIRGGIGDVRLVPPELSGGNITQDVARISNAPGVDANWLLLALQTASSRAQVVARTTGATIRGLNIWELKRVMLPMSDAERQQKDLAALRPALHRMQHVTLALAGQINLLRERRQALITAAVTGELSVPGAAA